MQRDEIFKQVKECVEEVLALEDEEEDLVQPHTSLVDDLGAESIDIVEIIQLLSRAFDIDIERNEVYPDRDFMTDEKFITEEQVITEEGASEIMVRWPHLDKNKIKTFAGLIQYLRSISLLLDFFEYKVAK